MPRDLWCMATALLIVIVIMYAFARGAKPRPRWRSRRAGQSPVFTNSLSNPRLNEDETIFDDDF